MREFLPFIVIGLTAGAIYALAALGLVLTYRTSGIFNFGHGAIAMASTYAFYSLRQHLPTVPALAIAVLVVAPVMGIVIDRALFRRLAGAGPTAGVVATLGLLVGMQGLALVIYGGGMRRLEPFLSTDTFRLFGVNVGFDQATILAVSLAAALGLVGFFRYSHVGLQTRAVVDNRTLSEFTGTNSARVTMLAWMLGCAFAAASGILFSATLGGVDSFLLTLLVVQAFGAAAVGHLRNFPRTVIAAFGLGVAQALLTKLVGQWGIRSLNGLPNALPTLLLFASVLLMRRGPVHEAPANRAPSGADRRPVPAFPARAVAASAVLTALLAPLLNGSNVLTLTSTVAFVLLFASLSLLVGLSRQLSLAHAIFVAFGAVGLAHLQEAGVPYLIALPLAGLILVPVGAALAIPTIRLSGLYLGLATLGFGVLAQDLLYKTELGFGAIGLVTIRRPGFITGDLAFFYFTLVVVMVGVVTVEAIRITRLGRILTAVADAPAAVGSIGISPLAARVVTFCVSAFLAGLAGGLLGSLVQSVNPNSFTFFQSLIWVTVLVAAGARTFGGVVVAAVLWATVPVLLPASFAQWQSVAFGLGAIVFAQAPNGVVGWLRRLNPTPLVEQSRWRLASDRALERRARAAGLEYARAVEVG